jgi:SPOR domain
MHKLFYIFFIISICFSTNNITAQTKSSKKVKKERFSKKNKAEKSLDVYFYGNKKGKKGKKGEKGAKGKKGEPTTIKDMKSLLKEKGNSGKQTSGGASGGNDQATYRPVYVGDKMVTGSINNVQGFRICIYTGNNREEAMAKKIDFMRKFPNVRSYMSYNTPYYKIKVGDFADKKEAQKILKVYLKPFPASFLIPDVVTVKNIMIYKNY